MKRKLKGITIPYLYYDKSKNYTYYIYKDKEYTNLDKLFTDFVGSYLTYHFNINEKTHEVHNLSEVLEALLKNKKSFSIPKNYKEEYSKEEYAYITKLQDRLLNEKLKIENNQLYEHKFTIKNIFEYRLFKFTKEIFEKYKKIAIPKKIHSNIFNHDYYVVAGSAYESIYHALDEVFDDSLYYQFGGTKKENNRSHFHSHNFDDLISLIFERSSKFKIHVFQQEFYSKQELEFLNKLADKLKKMKFHSVERNIDELDYEEYFYLKDNKKYLSLLIHNIRFYKEDKKYRNDVLNSHKI